jgi:hypothetical protein
MNEQPTPQAIARQMEHIHNELDIAKGQLMILTGMAMQLEPRISLMVSSRRCASGGSHDQTTMRQASVTP